MSKGIMFVAILFFLGLLLILFQGNSIKGLMTHYLTETKGYVCEGNHCAQCTIENTPCFCGTETCQCGYKTVDKKLCIVKLLWNAK